MNLTSKLQKFLLLVCIPVIFLTSCFEIREELHMKSSSSGTYISMVDMSSSPMGQMILSQATESGGDSLTNAMDSLSEIQKNKLGEIKGISNIIIHNDMSKLQFGLEFDFASIESLGEALSISGKSKDQFEFSKGSFTLKTKSFDPNSIKNALGGNEEEGGAEQEMAENQAMQEQMMQQLFSSAKYVFIFEAPSKVKKVSNSTATFSGNKKTSKLELPLGDLEKDGKGLEIKYSYK